MILLWKQISSNSFKNKITCQLYVKSVKHIANKWVLACQKNIIYKLCIYKSYIIFIENLAENNLQWLICHNIQLKTPVWRVCVRERESDRESLTTLLMKNRNYRTGTSVFHTRWRNCYCLFQNTHKPFVILKTYPIWLISHA